MIEHQDQNKDHPARVMPVSLANRTLASRTALRRFAEQVARLSSDYADSGGRDRTDV